MPSIAFAARGFRWGCLWIPLLAATTAHAAEKVHPVPIKTKREAYYCDDLDMLKWRERLQRQGDTVNTERFNMVMGPFGGQCGRIAADKWVFYTGWSLDGRYLAIRFRFDGKRSWVSRSSLGEMYDLLPGRTPPKANEGSSCKEWEPVARQASERSAALAASLQTRSRQQSFIQMTVETAAGVKDSMGACENFTQRLIEYSRERRAIRFCPKLDNGRRAEIEKLQDNGVAYLQQFCLSKQ